MSAEDELKAYTKAVKVIGGHKAQITQASVVLHRVVKDGKIEEGSISKIKSAKSMVEKQVSKIEVQMDQLLDNSNLKETTLQDLTDYILDMGNLCEEINSIIEQESSRTDTTTLDTSGIGAALSESLMQVQSRQPIPAADLPSFNGEPAEYMPFIEAFNFMVHDNENISDSMKVNYLKRCIKD